MCSSNIKKLVEEFSHTVLHGENFKNKIQSLANKPAAVGTPRVALTPRSNLNNGGGVNKPVVYDPSKVYKSPVVPRGPLIAQPQPQQAAQQPLEKKATPTPVARKRPNSAQRESVESSSERNKPIGYLEQQRLKRAAAEEERLKKRHLELIEKQRVRKNKHNYYLIKISFSWQTLKIILVLLSFSLINQNIP